MPHVMFDDKTKIDEAIFFFAALRSQHSFSGAFYFCGKHYHCYPMHVIRWYVGHVIDDFAKEFRWFFVSLLT